MTRSLKLTMAVAAAAFTLAAAAPNASADDEKKYYEVADRAMKQMDAMVSAIETVKDEASAKAAAEQLNKIADQFTKLAKEVEGMDEPSEQTQQALQKKFEKKEKELEKRMEAWQESLAGVDETTGQAIMEHIFPPLMKIGAAAERLDALGGDDDEDDAIDDAGEVEDDAMDDAGDEVEDEAEEEAPAM